MFKNYLKIAIRNIMRHKVFSMINIAGLAIGLVVCILILLWVQDEYKFDRFHKNYARIHRILVDINTNGEEFVVGVTPAALAPNIIDQVPEFEEICRFKNWGPFQMRLSDEDQYIGLQSGIADPSIFKIFSFPLISGDPETALLEAHSLVLTREAAENLFGDEDPLGKIVQVKNRGDFTVTGLIENVDHSHFDFQFLTPFHLIREDGENIDDLNQGSFNFTTYVLLKEGTDPAQVDNKIKDFFASEDAEAEEPIPFLQPLKDIYLRSNAAYDFTIRGDQQTIYVFSFIAALVLLIACINFMNLATAKSSIRAREIGIRKVSGSSRGQLIIQFFLEALLYAFLGMIIALILTELLLPVFNEISGKEITSQAVQSAGTIFMLLGITLFTGFMAGIYPALTLSSYKPVNVLKSKLGGKKGSVLRTIMVISQFSLSIILLIAAVTIRKQLKFIYDKDLGYNKHNLVFMHFSPTLKEKFPVLKESLLQFPEVTHVSNSRVLPVYECPGFSTSAWEGKQDDSYMSIHMIAVEYDWIKTFEIELLAGRDFSNDIEKDANSVILNEKAIERMGMEDPVGKHIFDDNMEIIGIIKDFNYNTIRANIEPLVLFHDTSDARYLLARINSQNSAETLKKMNKVIKEVDSDVDWEFRFFDQTLQNLYRVEQDAGKLITYFTVLAIFISCLGLFGLVGYITERRTKEIGIRKVMGSSVTGITVLLAKQFCKWVLISTLIACPIAYYIMQKWLQNFAYKTELGIATFLLAGLAALFIAIFTISFQTIKTARANPAEALKYE